MPPCAVEFIERFAKDVQVLPAATRLEIEETLRRLSQTFGQPHLHTGLGIRRLKHNYFECRVGSDLRMVFKLDGSVLTMTRIGNHEDVRRFIKGT